MDLKPGAVGLAVGIGRGVLAKTSLGKHTYSGTFYAVGAFLLGIGGEMLWEWDPAYTYGLMTAATALTASRIAPALQSGSTALGDVSDADVIDGDVVDAYAAATDTSNLAGQFLPEPVRALPAPSWAHVAPEDLILG